ncbi:MAG: EF-hand domain-containing protein [Alphaproteobacteria bacterium]|nr:EF-hand domain-containing protein [Alphaproteobacteria bacterium SS10]
MSKKTETIEFRVAPETKQRWASDAADAGQSLSEYIRSRVETANTPPLAKPSAWQRYQPVAIAAAAIVALTVGWQLGGQSSAQAQSEMRVWFSEMDQNLDGQVVFGEFEAFHRQEHLMEAREIQAMGRLNGCANDAQRILAEFQQELSEGMDWIREDFAEMDRNRDQRLSYPELIAIEQAERTEFFAEVDMNGDGRIEIAEFRQMIEADIAEEAAEASEEFDEEDEFAELSPTCRNTIQALEAAENVEDDGPEAMERMVRAEFAAMDANYDRQITRDEFLNH